ncbi:chorismate-binding protein [Lacinutrix salivirga]
MEEEQFFLNLEKQLDNKLPFVAYRKPNSTTISAMLQNNDTVHLVTDYTECGFVFTPFNIENPSVLIPFNTSEIISLDSFSSVKNNRIVVNSTSETSKQNHISVVKKAIKAIEEGVLDKVVISRAEDVTLTESNPIALFKRLLSTYTTTFTYCWYHPKVGLWLGATPETLIKTEGNRFKTMALAGTQQYNSTLDVSWKAKEKQEQQFVTDFIVNSLKNSAERINTSKVTTSRAGNMLHLKTEISGVLDAKKTSLKEVLLNLHPTPATCGLPKDKAKQFILQHENYNREFYTGFLGELNFKIKSTRNTNKRNVENNAYSSVKTVSDLFVNLRCMQIQQETALVYVGGGITKDSNPELEWQETVNKSATMKKVLF